MQSKDPQKSSLKDYVTPHLTPQEKSQQEKSQQEKTQAEPRAGQAGAETSLKLSPNSKPKPASKAKLKAKAKPKKKAKTTPKTAPKAKATPKVKLTPANPAAKAAAKPTAKRNDYFRVYMAARRQNAARQALTTLSPYPLGLPERILLPNSSQVRRSKYYYPLVNILLRYLPQTLGNPAWVDSNGLLALCGYVNACYELAHLNEPWYFRKAEGADESEEAEGAREAKEAEGAKKGKGKLTGNPTGSPAEKLTEELALKEEKAKGKNLKEKTLKGKNLKGETLEGQKPEGEPLPVGGEPATATATATASTVDTANASSSSFTGDFATAFEVNWFLDTVFSRFNKLLNDQLSALAKLGAVTVRSGYLLFDSARGFFPANEKQEKVIRDTEEDILAKYGWENTAEVRLHKQSRAFYSDVYNTLYQTMPGKDNWEYYQTCRVITVADWVREESAEMSEEEYRFWREKMNSVVVEGFEKTIVKFYEKYEKQYREENKEENKPGLGQDRTEKYYCETFVEDEKALVEALLKVR